MGQPILFRATVRTSGSLTTEAEFTGTDAAVTADMLSMLRRLQPGDHLEVAVTRLALPGLAELADQVAAAVRRNDDSEPF